MRLEPDSDPDDHRLELPALPPVIFGVPVFIGALVHVLIWRHGIIGGITGVVIGVILILIGILMIYWTWKVMRVHGEHPEPRIPTHTFAAGLAIALNAMAILISVFFGVAALTAFVIRREEAYLEHVFGDIYVNYSNRTGRWL
jgi:protein-S-isoprenylcysteine O-methyltransferase Ste14